MKVLTLGTFDLLHHGHLRLLERARALGTLYVGVNSDRFVTEYKGRPPAQRQIERIIRVARCGFAAGVLLNDGPGRKLIEREEPNLIVVGSDWLDRDYLAQINVTREFLEERRIGVLFLPRTSGISSSELRAA